MDKTGRSNLPPAELVANNGTRLAVHDEQSIGRSSVNDIVVSASEISIKHALLRWANDTLVVEDLNSSNGTTVNGKRVNGAGELCDGDILCFATTCYVVSLPDAESSDATVVIPVTPQETLDLSNQTIVTAASRSTCSQALGPVVVPLEIHTRGDIERASTLPHLLILDASGQVSELLELEVGEGDRPNVWEIGRNANCQIALKGGSISDRHAQLRHEKGAWRLVNLLATNGVYVNNVKQLSTTLADGDRIRLGDTQLLFREHSAQPGKIPIKPSEKPEAPQLEPELTERSSTLSTAVTIAFVFLLLGAGAYLISLAQIEAP